MVVTSAPPEAQVLSYRFTDLEELRSFYADRFGARVSLDPSSAVSHTFRLDALRMGAVTVGRVRPHADMTAVVDPLALYTLAVARTGRACFEERGGPGDCATPTRAAIYRPARAARVTRVPAGSDMIYVQFDRFGLERHLQALIGRPVRQPIDFVPGLDMTPGAGWLRLFHFLTDGLYDRGSLVYQPLVAAPLHEAMMTALLTAAQHPYRDDLAGPAPRMRPRGVKLVMDVVQANPEEPYTLVMLARVAGVSVRTLQEGFQRYVGVSPMSYLRQVRLARVHDELRHGAAATVAEAAHRWGFTHLGRFAGAYAAVYGVPPSTTWRQARNRF